MWSAPLRIPTPAGLWGNRHVWSYPIKKIAVLQSENRWRPLCGVVKSQYQSSPMRWRDTKIIAVDATHNCDYPTVYCNCATQNCEYPTDNSGMPAIILLIPTVVQPTHNYSHTAGNRRQSLYTSSICDSCFYCDFPTSLTTHNCD